MTRKLVFIHGRAQQGKDSKALKAEWIQSFEDGLRESGQAMPIEEKDIRFPYYGDTLDGLVSGKSDDEIAEVVIRGPKAGSPERAFMSAVLEEVRKKAGISVEDLAEVAGDDVVQRGPLNWEWMQTILKAIDRHVPLGSGMSIALATYDVYQYLNNPVVAKRIDDGVLRAIEPGVPTVVVSHSLGTVVAYNLLKRKGKARKWNVPLFVTLGSPLAVTRIREAVAPRDFPSSVGKWFNAMDTRDVVSLYPLDKSNFSVDPGQIENKTDVRNPTENRHGISGYLGDKEVASRVRAALAI